MFIPVLTLQTGTTFYDHKNPDQTKMLDDLKIHRKSVPPFVILSSRVQFGHTFLCRVRTSDLLG